MMCLAVPLKVIGIKGNKALVGQEGIKLEIDIRLVPDISSGDFVLVHAGFAIQKIDTEAAKEILEIAKRIDEAHGS